MGVKIEIKEKDQKILKNESIGNGKDWNLF